MKHLLLPALLITSMLVMPACADNQTASTPEGEDNKEWILGGEEGPDQGIDLDMTQDQGAPRDATMMMPTPTDMQVEPPDQGVFRDIDDEFDEEDFGAPDFGQEDFGSDDFGAPDPGEPDFGQEDMGSMEGEGCGNSNECASGLVCCANRNGQFSCTAENRCFTGGICEINDDCPGMQECCDLSRFGVQQNVCRDRCRGGGGGGGGMTGCQNNSECTGADEVCCPSFQGAAMCTPSAQCQTGGSCATDSDCLNAQTCCDFFGQTALCLDQCPF